MLYVADMGKCGNYAKVKHLENFSLKLDTFRFVAFVPQNFPCVIDLLARLFDKNLPQSYLVNLIDVLY